ncbi:MAG: hypothetical protein ICV52_11535 [Microcoleus sp. C1-bin4]|nr:hypothetical protein [Microcoleus sp. C1-bin4]
MSSFYIYFDSFPTADTDTAVPFPYGGYGHGSDLSLRRTRTRQCRFSTADTVFISIVGTQQCCFLFLRFCGYGHGSAVSLQIFCIKSILFLQLTNQI